MARVWDSAVVKGIFVDITEEEGDSVLGGKVRNLPWCREAFPGAHRVP